VADFAFLLHLLGLSHVVTFPLQIFKVGNPPVLGPSRLLWRSYTAPNALISAMKAA
jgi:hypothetical protein